MSIRVTSKTIQRTFPLADLSGLPTTNPGGGKPWLSGGFLGVGNFALNGAAVIAALGYTPANKAGDIFAYNGSNNVGSTHLNKYLDDAYFIQYNAAGNPGNVLRAGGSNNSLRATDFTGDVNLGINRSVNLTGSFGAKWSINRAQTIADYSNNAAVGDMIIRTDDYSKNVIFSDGATERARINLANGTVQSAFFGVPNNNTTTNYTSIGIGNWYNTLGFFTTGGLQATLSSSLFNVSASSGIQLAGGPTLKNTTGLSTGAVGVYQADGTTLGQLDTNVVRTIYLQTINPAAQTLTAVAYGYSFRMGGTEVPRVQIDPTNGLGIGVNPSGMSAGVWLKDNSGSLEVRNNSGSLTSIAAGFQVSSTRLYLAGNAVVTAPFSGQIAVNLSNQFDGSIRLREVFLDTDGGGTSSARLKANANGIVNVFQNDGTTFGQLNANIFQLSGTNPRIDSASRFVVRSYSSGPGTSLIVNGASSGLEVKDYGESTWAPITAGPGVFTGTSTVVPLVAKTTSSNPYTARFLWNATDKGLNVFVNGAAGQTTVTGDSDIFFQANGWGNTLLSLDTSSRVSIPKSNVVFGNYTGSGESPMKITGSGGMLQLLRTGMNDTTLGEHSGTSFAIRNNGDSSLMMTINNSTKQAEFFGITRFRPYSEYYDNIGTFAGYIGNGNSLLTSGASTASDLAIRAAGKFGVSVGGSVAPSLVINGSGFVGLNVASPNTQLDVAGAGYYTAQFIGNGGSAGGVYVQAGKLPGTDPVLAVYSNSGNTHVMSALANGNVTIGGDLTIKPSASRTPANNGELTVEATSNTTLTFKLKGSDGTVRIGTITLS